MLEILRLCDCKQFWGGLFRMMCASAPLSVRWQVCVTMICLKWGDNDVRFGSAQPTVTVCVTMICLKWGDNDVRFDSAQRTVAGVGTMICLKWNDMMYAERSRSVSLFILKIMKNIKIFSGEQHSFLQEILSL
ncbi:hypothetical protein QX233_13030 [Chryseobacterium gambrini]|uniref:Uncharacterized protein n=1 Tax=Chryseobacterium gambrini TaxID=373672 RepID=A0AAJ1R488_9FLAO|nr:MULTISPECIES: hypothetical protein [Chryseobacterium]MDN4013393.1 hypothetical protein [Chryseobacterium gambrini]MDN4031601.1 hypothetical protein [Chryseobacterium gambrini]QWA39473.1 hypothetical protein KKI44_04490 [Chryseobacterium sp. ZHDP1]